MTTPLGTIQHRRDTSAAFTTANPVLQAGQLAYETDTKRFRIGDGTSTYTALAPKSFRDKFRVLPGWSADQMLAVMDPETDHIFGTSNPIQGGTRITNLTDLAVYYRPFEDGTNLTTVNNEVERYQPFNAGTHNFMADRLSLECPAQNLPPSVVCQANTTGINLNGNPTPIANLGLTTTAGIHVNQMVFVQFEGLYYVTAVITDTSVTVAPLGSPHLNSDGSDLYAKNFIVVFSQWCIAFLQNTTVSATTMQFQLPLPDQLVVGMQVGSASGTNSSAPLARSGHYIVSAINPTTGVVNFTSPNNDKGWYGTIQYNQGNPAATTYVAFGPNMPSGQIWSKQFWNFANTDYQAMAFDGYFYMPPVGLGGPLVDTGTMRNLTQYNAMPVDVPWGYWPAYWLYSANNGTTPASLNNKTSEMDLTELWCDSTKGLWAWTGGNVNKFPPGQGANYYVRTMPGESATNIGLLGTSSPVLRYTQALTGVFRLTFIWTPEHTYRYVNGVLTKADRFELLTANAMQIGVNMACGSLTPGFAANLQVPLRYENFNNMKFGISRLRTFVVY